MIAVVPSGPGVFGFVPFDSNCSTAARSPRSAASRSVLAAAEAIEGAARDAATRFKMQNANCKSGETPRLCGFCMLPFAFCITPFILNLREDATAVSDLLHR